MKNINLQWYNQYYLYNKIWQKVLLKMLLLTLLCCLLQMQLNVAADRVFRNTEAQKIAFFTNIRTNGACVDNFMRLWHEEMSAEERAHWDGIEGLKLEHFDKFIKFFNFSFKSGLVTMDTSKFKLIADSAAENSEESGRFNLYIFQGFSFYFSPTGQISHRNMAKIFFFLSWQRFRLKAYDEQSRGFTSFFFLNSSVHMCDVLDAAFRMPMVDELEAKMDNRRAKLEERCKGKAVVTNESSSSGSKKQWIKGFFNNKKSQEHLDVRARFQKLFGKLHRSSSKSDTENCRRTKLEAIFNQWLNGKFDYWSRVVCPVMDAKLSTALAKFAQQFIETTPRLRIRSYNEMKEHFDPEEWELVQQIVYKYMELYGHGMTTSFDPYSASELPVLLFICLYINSHWTTHLPSGNNQKKVLVTLLKEGGGDMFIPHWRRKNDESDEPVHLNLRLLLDAWKPRWLLKATNAGRGIYPFKEPMRRILMENADDDDDGKRKSKEGSEKMDVQILMPIDEMNVWHIDFLLKTQQQHSSADWKWSGVKSAPIQEIKRHPINQYLAFDIKDIMKEEDEKMGLLVKKEMFHYSSEDKSHLDWWESRRYYSRGTVLNFQQWIRRSYMVFKLRHLTTTKTINDGGDKGSSSSSNTGKSSTSPLFSVLTEAQRLDFAVQIYLRLFRTFVDKLGNIGEQQRRREAGRIPTIASKYFLPREFYTEEEINATLIGRKLLHLIGKWELEKQREIFSTQKEKPISRCDEVSITPASDNTFTWIDDKLTNFWSQANGGFELKALLTHNDPCIEASTQWVRRLLTFDLEPAYQTSLAWKLLDLVSYPNENIIRIGLDDEEQRMTNKGPWIWTEQSGALKKMFSSLNTKLWQWTQRRLETMVAMLPQGGEPLENLVPKWAEQIKTYMGTKRTIQRSKYKVKELDLVRLFAYVQLGALISLNRLIAEWMWKDLMNEKSETGERGKLLNLRLQLVGRLHSLHHYIKYKKDANRTIRDVPGLQPTAIRPNQNQNLKNEHGNQKQQQEGKSELEMAKMFEKHEALRKEMAKHGRMVEIKMLAKKRQKRIREQQHQQQQHFTQYHQKFDEENVAVASAVDSPFSSPFSWLGYYHYQQDVEGETGESSENDEGENWETLNFSSLGFNYFDDNLCIYNFMSDHGNIELDWSVIFAMDFSTDGLSDILSSFLFAEAKNINPKNTFSYSVGGVGGGGGDSGSGFSSGSGFGSGAESSTNIGHAYYSGYGDSGGECGDGGDGGGVDGGE